MCVCQFPILSRLWVTDIVFCIPYQLGKMYIKIHTECTLHIQMYMEKRRERRTQCDLSPTSPRVANPHNTMVFPSLHVPLSLDSPNACVPLLWQSNSCFVNHIFFSNWVSYYLQTFISDPHDNNMHPRNRILRDRDIEIFRDWDINRDKDISYARSEQCSLR